LIFINFRALLDREGAWGIFYSVSSEEPFLVNPKYSGNLENYWETKGKKDDCSGELPSPSFNNFCLSL
jgi:hypothetical protein